MSRARASVHRTTARSLLVTIVSFCTATSAHGTAPCATTDACLAEVQAAQRVTETLRARFTQTKHMSLLNEPLVATGQFAFKRPDRVRWEIQHPEQATVIISNGHLVIPGLPEKEQEALATLPVASAMAQMGALFTGDLTALREAFDASANRDDGDVQVHLVARETQTTQTMFRRIDLTFVAPRLTLGSIRLENRLGDRVEVTLDDVVVNSPIADSQFALPPAK